MPTPKMPVSESLTVEDLISFRDRVQGMTEEEAKTATKKRALGLPSPQAKQPVRTEHISDPPLTAKDLCFNLFNAWIELAKHLKRLAPALSESPSLAVSEAKSILQSLQDNLFINFTDSCFLSNVFELQYFLNAIFMADSRTTKGQRNTVVPIPTLMCVSRERPPLDLYEALRVLEVYFDFNDITTKLKKVYNTGNGASLVSVWGKAEAMRVVEMALQAADGIKKAVEPTKAEPKGKEETMMDTGANKQIMEGYSQSEVQEKLGELAETLKILYDRLNNSF